MKLFSSDFLCTNKRFLGYNSFVIRFLYLTATRETRNANLSSLTGISRETFLLLGHSKFFHIDRTHWCLVLCPYRIEIRIIYLNPPHRSLIQQIMNPLVSKSGWKKESSNQNESFFVYRNVKYTFKISLRLHKKTRSRIYIVFQTPSL